MYRRLVRAPRSWRYNSSLFDGYRNIGRGDSFKRSYYKSGTDGRRFRIRLPEALRVRGDDCKRTTRIHGRYLRVYAVALAGEKGLKMNMEHFHRRG